MKKNGGFTLIEMMVATVVGLTAVSAVYGLGSAMSKQFYQEQRTAVSQGTARAAIMELRRDISRAALFGTPNAQLETGCGGAMPTLPQLGGGTYPMGAFQYYPDEDIDVLDPDSVNRAAGKPVRADRLRLLSSLYLTDQLLVQNMNAAGNTLVLQSDNQAYRRTFMWGQVAGDIAAGADRDYLRGGLTWEAAWSSEAANWKGISQRGARAFQTGSVLHIESAEGRHFFRTTFDKGDNTQNEIRLTVNPALPVGTACLPGLGESASVAPLQWVEYALIDPYAAIDGDDDFMDLDGVFDDSFPAGHPVQDIVGIDPDDPKQLLEQRNVVLVRRFLDPTSGDVLPRTTQVLAEFVSSFAVSFMYDQKTNRTQAADITGPTRDDSDINDDPHRVRSVLIELGIRSPLEDPSIPFDATSTLGTRFEVDEDQDGSARVRYLRMEIPVMSLARRNLL